MEIITLIIALAGFSLSIYQEIRKYKNEQRKIKISLIHVLYEERYKISIVNLRKRPIILRDISMGLYWINLGINPVLWGQGLR